MAAYLVALVDVSDPERFAAYQALARPGCRSWPRRGWKPRADRTGPGEFRARADWMPNRRGRWRRTYSWT